MGHLLEVSRLPLPALAGVVAMALAGCGSGGPLARAVATAQQVVGGNKPGTAKPAKAMSDAEMAASDEPLLRARVAARGIDGTLTVRDSDGGLATWTTGGGITFTFRDGLLIETRGLGSDLMSSAAPRPAQLVQTGTEYRRAYYVTAPENGIEQRVYTCKTESIGREIVTLAGEDHAVLHLRETCLRATGKLTSDYWLEGQIVRKSRQWVSPGAGYAEFVLIKDQHIRESR